MGGSVHMRVPDVASLEPLSPVVSAIALWPGSVKLTS